MSVKRWKLGSGALSCHIRTVQSNRAKFAWRFELVSSRMPQLSADNLNVGVADFG
jgi:hypothetical protein